MRRRSIIRTKPFLRDIYEDWYARLQEAIPAGGGQVLELGSGAGFLAERLPTVITSEVFVCPFVKVVFDGQNLPFAPGSLKAVVMTNVLHHIARPASFLDDAAIAIRPGGAIAMIEPWRTPWSEFIYRRLHHEPFDPDGPFDGFEDSGPLSSANGALPWILFERDRDRFVRRWPEWRIERVEPMMPFRYLVSGGVSMRTLMPGWTTTAWRRLERAFRSRMDAWSMFACIVLRRAEVDHSQ